MEISGTRVLPVDRAKAWKSLYDADLIRESLPGCESLEWISDHELKGKITVRFGAVRAKFQILLTVIDAVEEESYTLESSAKAGPLGFASSQAKVKLVDVEEGCELVYEAQVRTGGKIAQIGSRLMSSMSKKMTEQFFDAFVAGMDK